MWPCGSFFGDSSTSKRQGCLGYQPTRACSHAIGLLGCTSWLMSRHFLRAHQELSALREPAANRGLLQEVF